MAAFATSNVGKPGDVLEHCVSYQNPGGSRVTDVTISDTVPTYTTARTAVPEAPYSGDVIVWTTSAPTVTRTTLSAASDADAGSLGAALRATICLDARLGRSSWQARAPLLKPHR